MKKKISFAFLTYLLLMSLSFLYCKVNMNEMSHVFMSSLTYSGIVVCIVLSTVLFVRSEYGNNLGIIPKKYYLYIVGGFMTVLFFQAIVSLLQTHSINRAIAFLPCLLGIISTYCFRKKFHID